jgi:type II secretory pathway predicted ATPase ExeA
MKDNYSGSYERLSISDAFNPRCSTRNESFGLRLSVQRALFTRISATAVLAPLARQDITSYLNWQVSRAGLERDIYEPAAIDLLAEASQGNPRTLELLAQAAWLGAARSGTTTIHPNHITSLDDQCRIASDFPPSP